MEWYNSLAKPLWTRGCWLICSVESAGLAPFRVTAQTLLLFREEPTKRQIQEAENVAQHGESDGGDSSIRRSP